MKLISLDEVNRLVEVCKILANAPFYQKLGAGGVLAIYLTAREMNLPPMFCLNGGLHNIEGKVVLSGQLINMMLVNAGYGIEFVEMNDKVCHLRFHYPNRKRVEEFKYTVEDAKKAGYFGVPGPQGSWARKPKDNWIYHTLDMLFARCITSGGRKYAPEVLGNCYGTGELDDNLTPLSPELPVIPYKSVEQVEEPVQAEPSLIENTSTAEMEAFREKYNIREGQPIYDYVTKIANHKKVSVERATELALINEETFIKAFEDQKK